ANNNVVVIYNDFGSNERLKDAIKHYDPIIHEDFGSNERLKDAIKHYDPIIHKSIPHNSGISKHRRQSKIGIRE
ncbi:3422_t:CDS:1, partial [Racocetra fulgida]